jgi:hypothetical protein
MHRDESADLPLNQAVWNGFSVRSILVMNLSWNSIAPFFVGTLWLNNQLIKQFRNEKFYICIFVRMQHIYMHKHKHTVNALILDNLHWCEQMKLGVYTVPVNLIEMSTIIQILVPHRIYYLVGGFYINYSYFLFKRRFRYCFKNLTALYSILWNVWSTLHTVYSFEHFLVQLWNVIFMSLLSYFFIKKQTVHKITLLGDCIIKILSLGGFSLVSNISTPG